MVEGQRKVMSFSLRVMRTFCEAVNMRQTVAGKWGSAYILAEHAASATAVVHVQK